MLEQLENLKMAAWGAGTRDRGRYYREIGQEPQRASKDRIRSLHKGAESTKGEQLQAVMLHEAWKQISARFGIDIRHPILTGEFLGPYIDAFYRDREEF